MKTEITAPAPEVNNKIDNNQESVSQLSDDAFYLIALASHLKKMIQPASMQQYLVSGNFIGFNDLSIS